MGYFGRLWQPFVQQNVQRAEFCATGLSPLSRIANSESELAPNFLDWCGNAIPLLKTRMPVLRAELEWSQANLPARLGVTRLIINSIEQGRFHPNPRVQYNCISQYLMTVKDRSDKSF